MAPSKKFDSKKVGPFIIDKVFRPVIYKLKLLPNMGIHPVFYQSLLEPIINKEAPQGGYWKFGQDESREFIVEKILEKKVCPSVVAKATPQSPNSTIPLSQKILGRLAEALYIKGDKASSGGYL